MTKIFNLFEKYVLEKLPQITFVSLTVVFFVNAFYNIALLNDGTFNFANILLNTLWTEERFFATFIVNLPMIIAIKLGSTDFNLFIILQGFWFFFITLICLFTAYINIPSKNKDHFQFVLLSYLITMNFVGAFISSKSFICAGLYWIIAVIFIFEDFNKITYKKLSLLLVVSFLLIKNYEWNVIFVSLLAVYHIFKIKMLNADMKISKEIFLYMIFFIFLLTISLFIKNFASDQDFFIYIAKNPLIEAFKGWKPFQFLITFAIIALIFSLSFFKNRNKLLFAVLISCFSCLLLLLIKYNFLYAIATYRLLNFFVPLFFSVSLFLVFKKNIFVNFKIIKILNMILLLFFIINISVIAHNWNKSLNNAFAVLNRSTGIVNAEDYPLSLQEGFQLHMWISIIIQKQRNIYYIESVFGNFDPKKPKNDEALKKLKDILYMPDLRKFGIIYSDDLLKKIQENSKLNSKIS